MKRRIMVYFVIAILLFSTVTVFAVTSDVVKHNQTKNELNVK